MSDINISPLVFANSLFGPEDERKAECIHCETVDYEIHHKDGVCPSCQKKDLPGKSVLERRATRNNKILAYVIVVIFLFLGLILAG